MGGRRLRLLCIGLESVLQNIYRSQPIIPLLSSPLHLPRSFGQRLLIRARSVRPCQIFTASSSRGALKLCLSDHVRTIVATKRSNRHKKKSSSCSSPFLRSRSVPKILGHFPHRSSSGILEACLSCERDTPGRTSGGEHAQFRVHCRVSSRLF